MRSKLSKKIRTATIKPFAILMVTLILLSLACALPVIGKPTPNQPNATLTPTEPPLPTATPQPLPPALVESDPPPGGEMSMEGPITLYFNQAMDRSSVEDALSGQMDQEITFTWLDDRTVVLYLSAPLPPETELILDLNDQARSSQGLSVIQPISLRYTTSGFLRLAQSIPEPGSIDIDPSSAVIAGFNRPIVPLGADSSSLPPAFTLSPAAQGRGEWINTSTYIFYPEPALEGGKQYSVQINPNLKSVDGGPLSEVNPWSFTTASPRLLSIYPITELPWPLDPQIELTFNQPMEPASVEANFRLLGPDGAAIPGASEWEEDFSIFTFTPDALLERNKAYIVRLDNAAQASGGTPLGETLEAQVVSSPPLMVYRTDPSKGGVMPPFGGLAVYFSAPLRDTEDLEQFFSFSPAVDNLSAWWDEEAQSVFVSANFAPSTEYTLTIAPTLADIWNGVLSQEYISTFRTAALPPGLILTVPSQAVYLTPQDTSLLAQATNISSVPLSIGSLRLDEFLRLLSPDGYEFGQSFRSPDQVSWEQPLDLLPNQVQNVDIYLRPDRGSLSPGIYLLRFNIEDPNIYAGPYQLVVSNVHLTFKYSASDVLVWAVDLRTDAPVSNAPVTIYYENGEPITSGQTDGEGVFRGDIQLGENRYGSLYAVVGQPGDDLFGLTLSTWSQGVQPWDFGLQGGFEPPGLKVYFYTDRPIYRPGQTVYFRAVVRQARNGRYQLPDLDGLPVEIHGIMPQPLATYDLPLSVFGTTHGQFEIPENALPGFYNIHSPTSPYSSIGFQVANYRKPEINLSVDFESNNLQAGETLRAQIDAQYFFGAPAGNLSVHWLLTESSAFFHLPGYDVGPANDNWIQPFYIPEFGGYGMLVDEGDAQTLPDGSLALEFDLEAQDELKEYKLEVTIVDESGLPVSSSDVTFVHPANFYIGVQSDAWVLRAGEESSFSILVVDWDKNPAGVRNLRADFQKVVWEEQKPDDPRFYSTFIPRYTAIASTDFSTSGDGQARLSFVPPEPGTYQLDIYDPQAGIGKGARSEVILWVGGPGQAIWPNIPNSRLVLTADREAYVPGDTATVFIPNTFGRPVQALVTVERSIVMQHYTLTIGPEGYEFNLPLTDEEAPNVYLSVTMTGQDAQGYPDFRVGYVNLPVEPVAQTLVVNLLSQPEQAGPGDEVSFEIQVSDSTGAPIQGEFSLSVVDLAVLALADPNAPDIVSAFYGNQPAGVSTGVALAAYARRFYPSGGMGGGGGAALEAVARENFPDTAYWNAEVITDEQGKAKVTLNLPDNLTTWQVDARGLTPDTIVGQAESQVITSKDLLVRPVTPRFLVVGDHVQLAAIVQNNTGSEIQAEVNLQANGVNLDNPGAALQTVNIPPNGRVRVEWWGMVQDEESADLVFSARGTDSAGVQYDDATRPALGALPIHRYTGGRAFRTAGVLDGPGELQELVSLPASFDPQNGQFNIELSPSLAGTTVSALEALEHNRYESTETTVSLFLPNLELYRVLSQAGIQDQGMKTRLDRTLNEGISRLQSQQNEDGGWRWWNSAAGPAVSDPYISAYALLGLTRARDAGISINLDMIQRAVNYLQASQFTVSPELDQAEIERQVFIQFVLSLNGEASPEIMESLYGQEHLLNPWARALLALSLENIAPGSPAAQALTNDLSASALRSASGAFWQINQDEAGLYAAQKNMHTSISNSAVVIYALAQRDPGSPLLADAMRYLMAHRLAEGQWATTYTTSWALMATSQVIRATGELGSEYTFSAYLNSNPLAQGQARPDQLTPVTAQVGIQRLYADYPNALNIERGGGPGRLYYTAGLLVSQPVAQAAPFSQGLSIERAYYASGEKDPIQSIPVGGRVRVRVTLTVPRDMHFLVVEDYIPAGAEILDTRLKTSQSEGWEEEPWVEEAPVAVNYDPRRPYTDGWGWWLFSEESIYDDHITWTADYLPAGTYELTYTLVILQPGEFNLLPARAWQFYFPDVQANSAGERFAIQP